MTLQPSQWLAEQYRRKRQLVLTVDTLAAPDAIATLFSLAPIRDYLRLFQGTEFDSLLAQSPWLIRIDPSTTPAIERLLQHPEQNWGWIGSADNLDLAELARHWRDRMVIRDADQRWLYRFQDNRVMVRHLSALDAHHIPLLLGPLAQALCWDGEAWLQFENKRPALYLPPFATPWTQVTESKAASHAIELRALENWLWQHHPTSTARLPVNTTLNVWLTDQLELATGWGWNAPEDILFLVQNRLDPTLAAHGLWHPIQGETPERHLQRVRHNIATLTVMEEHT
ncbi:DUF4123 domain-containing protein [Pseudomonas sp. CDFA 602]|uniref:DUF4123 domain-containing protein n=1 Tax=Pseudomonas californiensis TaxID=2829823 RepID=UPI001E653233|nr:DUF4123 domain-containing protein [Pseudomonas californiensis]MCD5995492.1 DUF4123 domain-containing protein [Pseudomonas californiensis]MCD6001086.1 DUF4123 domain-containing protein [Pseudomonas californiensis]